jgi:DNA-binding response OmpR family regulator
VTKLVVIEDEAQLRENLCELLSAEGFEVTAAENGAVGLLAVRSAKPALVVCDVAMPVLDGWGVLEALRADEETASLPVIMLTARADASDVARGKELGASEYLTKPFNRAVLLEAIRAHVPAP